MDETSWTTVRYNIITQHLLGFAEGGQRSALPPPPPPLGGTQKFRILLLLRYVVHIGKSSPNQIFP